MSYKALKPKTSTHLDFGSKNMENSKFVSKNVENSTLMSEPLQYLLLLTNYFIEKYYLYQLTICFVHLDLDLFNAKVFFLNFVIRWSCAIIK